MVETAAHLVDHVFPAVPVRQWVVSLPKRLRYFLIRDARLLNRVVRIALNEMERAIRAHSPGAPDESGSGGVVFIHRFGSALNVHIHVHACLIDGLIGRTSEGLSFHPVQLDEADITAVSEAIRQRVLRSFERRGLLSDEAARGMRQWGHGGGFSVHGAVRVHGNDRAGRERLFRYCARPLFAAERLVLGTRGATAALSATTTGAPGRNSPDVDSAGVSGSHCSADPTTPPPPSSLFRCAGAELTLAPGGHGPSGGGYRD